MNNKPTPVSARQVPPPIVAAEPSYRRRKKKSTLGSWAGPIIALGCFAGLVGAALLFATFGNGIVGSMAVENYFATQRDNPEYSVVQSYSPIACNGGIVLRLKYRQNTPLGIGINDELFVVQGNEVVGTYDDYQLDEPLSESTVAEIGSHLVRLAQGARQIELDGRNSKGFRSDLYMGIFERYRSFYDDENDITYCNLEPEEVSTVKTRSLLYEDIRKLTEIGFKIRIR